MFLQRLFRSASQRTQQPAHPSKQELTRYAHRGLALNHTENTLEAFAAAVQAGAHWIETDVRSTSDGTVMVFHDATLERVANRNTAIAYLTYAQVQDVTLPCGAKIPTLAEALQTFPNLSFNIDLKDSGSALAIGQILQETSARGRVRLASFSEERLCTARRSLQRAGIDEIEVRWGGAERSMILFYLTAHLAPGLWPRVQKLLAGYLSEFDALQIPLEYSLLGLRLPVLTKRLLTTAHRYGYRVDVWTIDDAQTMKKLWEQGVDGIVTNRVDTLGQLVL